MSIYEFFRPLLLMLQGIWAIGSAIVGIFVVVFGLLEDALLAIKKRKEQEKFDKVRELDPEKVAADIPENRDIQRAFMEHLLPKQPSNDVLLKLTDAVSKLYELEEPQDPEVFLRYMKVMGDSFLKTLPKHAFGDPFEEITGYAVQINPTPEMAASLAGAVFTKANPCPETRRNIAINGNSLGPMNKYDGFMGDYFRHTPLYPIFHAKLPFNFESKRDLGWYICSPAGKGKTNLLTYQLLRDAETRGSIIVLDSKGDLINAIRDLKLPKRVVVIDPDPYLALNPLQIGASSTHAVAFLEYLFSSLMDTKTTPLQSTLFRSIFMVMTKVPDASFANFRHFLIHGWKDYESAIRKLDPEDQEFFTRGEYDSQTYRETKQQLLWRIRDLTTSVPILREMFRSPTTKINMTKWMDSQNIYLVNNSKQVLDDRGAEFFGRFFIAMIRAAADQRSNRRPEDKNPVRLYMDECHTVIAKDEKLAGILDECRSQRIQVIAAHQRIPQIQSANVLDALSNCGIRFANSDEDAPALATRLRTTPQHLQQLPTGTFAAYVRDLTPTAATIQIPLVDLSSHPQIDHEEQRFREHSFRQHYCYQPHLAVEIHHDADDTW